MISYQLEPELSAAEYIELLQDNSLGGRRPIEDEERIEHMLRKASIIATARENGKLLGLARSLSDLVYVSYLSDLAVRNGYQGKGIGRQLMIETFNAAPEAKIVLLAAPSAESYYPALGLQKHAHCFMINSVDELIGSKG
jgi:ribosomal protein S18 acetylase RimI-like enzyme